MTTPIEGFADAVAQNFAQLIDAQPEDQLKAPVGELMRELGAVAGLEVMWRTEVRAGGDIGRPDLGVAVGGLLVGHIELKAPGTGARPERFRVRSANGQQWKRFQQLPNLVYTDGSEWSLYRSGVRAARVRVADDVSEDGAGGLDDRKTAELEKLLTNFLMWEPVSPSSAEGLAEFLAPLARILRDDVRESLERDDSPLRNLRAEWSRLLFPDMDDAQFADAYAQTLTYALLLARFEGAESLRPAFAAETLEREHALLADAVALLEARPVRRELAMPIELLERAIGAVDAAAVGSDDDPWLYFYEQFLGAYDPKMRKERGVYFTPVEVVRAQVRLAGELLRTRFGKRLAFADDDVVTLDPAVGTGTYPLAILDHAEDTVADLLGAGAVPARLRDLAERLYGFEILVGPYAVARLRISQRLRDTEIANAPARIYLTDTLESPNALPDFRASLLQERLTEERARAQTIKKDTRVMVCIGNPPYERDLRDPNVSEETGRKGGWVRHGDTGADEQPILEDFLASVRDAGGGRDLKTVYNDYVYFWRWAMWKVLDSTEEGGIVSFITASSYLRGPGFAGMRRKMREVFDDLWIIDLEGDSIGTRKTDNVFAIRIPVAIAVGIRNGKPKPDTPANVWKVRLTGSEQEKLGVLDAAESFNDLDWRECSQDWDAPFYPSGAGTYFDCPSLADMFPLEYTGSVLYRTWPIGVTEAVLEQRWRSLVSRQSDELRSAFRETRDRKVDRSYPRLFDHEQRHTPIAELDASVQTPITYRYAFRSFDRQYVIADARVGDFMRPQLWRAHGAEQVYLTTLLSNVIGDGQAAVATGSVPDQHHFCGRGDKGVIPLWRDADATQPNVTHGVLTLLDETYGAPVPAERLFAYAYGILAQPGYVRRFWDELELPPPRLPLTRNAALFDEVADHGARLLYLHTWGERYRGANDDGYVPQGAARCVKAVPLDTYPEGYEYDAATQTLRVGDGEFAPVPPEVWEFSVSGYQVVKSWLDRRKREPSGRKSSPLDEIRPARWDFTQELLELLWVLEATLAMREEGEALLDSVCAGPLFSADELPTPTPAERQPPRTGGAQGALIE